MMTSRSTPKSTKKPKWLLVHDSYVPHIPCALQPCQLLTLSVHHARICVVCQGKAKLGLTGPTKGALDKVPEQPESEEDPSDADDDDDKRGKKSALELTQGQQDFYGVS